MSGGECEDVVVKEKIVEGRTWRLGGGAGSRIRCTIAQPDRSAVTLKVPRSMFPARADDSKGSPAEGEGAAA